MSTKFVFLALTLLVAAVLAAPIQVDANSIMARALDGAIGSSDAQTDGRSGYDITKRFDEVDEAAGRSGYDITKRSDVVDKTAAGRSGYDITKA
ncbi:hypothetical protein INS49_000875 [Diaporthe citri]|uniref:uncharacterized protein n=1 Tax=Diaporthe citri TaxID=83186 RepID=UPI001C7E6690|nr:uncharacterized protein INS49_000875 [Diaporthe citri]KAG6366696.1 hypothetical protein INS49_000875 [Diaporthe citri]